VRLPSLTCLLLIATHPMHAQWRAMLLIGSATSRGDARAELDPQRPELRADRPGSITIGVAHDAGPWRLAIDLHRTSADLTEAGTSSSVTTPDLLKAWGAGVEVGRRIAGRSDAAVLMIVAGATYDRWTFDLTDNSPRSRAAARGALEADLPIGRRWSAVIRWQATVGPSVFNANELPDGFTSRTAIRSGIGLGLSVR